MQHFSSSIEAELILLSMHGIQLSLFSVILWLWQHQKPRKKSKSWKSTQRAQPGKQRVRPWAKRGTVTMEMRANAEMSNRAPWTTLLAVDSPTRSRASSLYSRSSRSSSLGSLSGKRPTYLSLEPWSGAMAELPDLQHSDPCQSPEALKGLQEKQGPALGQVSPHELLTGNKQRQVPRHGEDRAQSPVDVQRSHGSSPAMATTGKLILTSCHTDEDAQPLTKELLMKMMVELAKEQGALGTCGEPFRGQFSFYLSRRELQEDLELLVDRLQPHCPSPQRQVPTGWFCDRVAKKLQRAGQCLWAGCARLWRCLKAYGKFYCCICLPRDWQQ
ncbi:uncharacterized protein [Heliangelus exortis]|uniref:uncharacterized protein n=1 Tax=Heliangelus exortis TaxID=472823 RepID=UPI003A90C83C